MIGRLDTLELIYVDRFCACPKWIQKKDFTGVSFRNEDFIHLEPAIIESVIDLDTIAKYPVKLVVSGKWKKSVGPGQTTKVFRYLTYNFDPLDFCGTKNSDFYMP